MAESLAAWRADHANFARLLDLLERQLARFHVGEQPDYTLLVDLVSYLRHYPDRVHHPREDVVFARLVEREPALELPLARLLQEHRVIAEAGANLLRLLEDVVEDAIMSRAAVEAAAAMYLVYYRHHLAAEEREIIPRAVQLLTPADWATVAAVPAEPDPLFGADFEQRYRELRRRIALEAHDAA